MSEGSRLLTLLAASYVSGSSLLWKSEMLIAPVCGWIGIPNGWSFNWESMATRERENLEKRCVESFLVVYLCCCFLSMIDAKGQLLYP